MSIVIFSVSSSVVRGRSAIPTCETMLSRSRLGTAGCSAGRAPDDTRDDSPDIDPDLIEEIKSFVEREGIGDVIVSAGSDWAAGPARYTVAPDNMSCWSEAYSISVSPIRT